LAVRASLRRPATAMYGQCVLDSELDINGSIVSILKGSKGGKQK